MTKTNQHIRLPGTSREAPDQAASTDQNGFTLFVVLVIMTALTIFGATVLGLAAIDRNIAGNYKKGVDALYHADAGVEYVLGRLRQDLAGGTLLLDQQNETVSYSSPHPFRFDTVTQLTRMPDGRAYLFEVTGHALDSDATIEVVFQPRGPFPYGLFARKKFEMKGKGVATTDAGSNCDMKLKGGSGKSKGGPLIDGNATPGPRGEVEHPDQVTGSVEPADHLYVLQPIPPSELADAKTYNNNASIKPAHFKDDKLEVSNGSLVLDAGTYYFSEIKMKSTTLTTTGPVTIYCDGKIKIEKKSKLNEGGSPDDLVILATSKDKVEIKGGVIHARVYAPRAKECKIKGGLFYGTVIAGGKGKVEDDSKDGPLNYQGLLWEDFNRWCLAEDDGDGKSSKDCKSGSKDPDYPPCISDPVKVLSWKLVR